MYGLFNHTNDGIGFSEPLPEGKWFVVGDIEPVKTIEIPEAITRLSGRKELTYEEVCELDREDLLDLYILSVSGTVTVKLPIQSKDWKFIVGTIG